MPTRRTIVVWDRCTVEGCNRTLHHIAEAERGTCASCWFKTISPETKKSLNRLIASAFNGSTEEQKAEAVKDAMERLKKPDE